MPKIHIPRVYRQYTADMTLYDSNKTALTSIFEELVNTYPSLIGTVFSKEGKPFPFVRIVVEESMIAVEDYSTKVLPPDAIIFLINAVAGG